MKECFEHNDQFVVRNIHVPTRQIPGMCDETSSEKHWQRLLDGLRSGSDSAYQTLWKDYGRLLQQVADNQLSSSVRRRVDADDIVQSVCRSFYRRATAGDYELNEVDELWRLLSAITILKVREASRFHKRLKRAAWRDRDGLSAESFQTSEASPEDCAIFNEEFARLVNHFGEEEKQIVDLKLQGFANPEIAARIGCSERTVRRLTKRIRQKLDEQLGEDSDIQQAENSA